MNLIGIFKMKFHDAYCSLMVEYYLMRMLQTRKVERNFEIKDLDYYNGK